MANTAEEKTKIIHININCINFLLIMQHNNYLEFLLVVFYNKKADLIQYLNECKPQFVTINESNMVEWS